MKSFQHEHKGRHFCLLCILQTLCLLLFGFCVYMGIEYAFRGYSYYTMGLFGAAAFFLIGKINDRDNIGLLWQGLIGGCLITLMELIGGSIILADTGMRMWDYSDRWMNYRGLICPLFSLCWCLLSVIAAVLDDVLKWILFADADAYIRIKTYGLIRAKPFWRERWKKKR